MPPDVWERIFNYGSPAFFLLLFLVVLWRFVAPILRDLASNHIELIRDLRNTLSKLQGTLEAVASELKSLDSRAGDIQERQKRIEEIVRKGTRE